MRQLRQNGRGAQPCEAVGVDALAPLGQGPQQVTLCGWGSGHIKILRMNVQLLLLYLNIYAKITIYTHVLYIYAYIHICTYILVSLMLGMCPLVHVILRPWSLLFEHPALWFWASATEAFLTPLSGYDGSPRSYLNNGTCPDR